MFCHIVLPEKVAVTNSEKNNKTKERIGFVLRLESDLHQKIRRMAFDRGESLNSICTSALTEWVQRQATSKRGAKKS